MTDPESTEPVVEVYWRPGCPSCRMLLRPLRRSGLRLREVNIWDDPAAAARVRSVADGNETVPTVFIGDHAMVNPSVRQVLAVALGEPEPAPWWTRWTR
jgi:glutaredoxin-like protein